jgi:hypothetical protein
VPGLSAIPASATSSQSAVMSRPERDRIRAPSSSRTSRARWPSKFRLVPPARPYRQDRLRPGQSNPQTFHGLSLVLPRPVRPATPASAGPRIAREGCDLRKGEVRPPAAKQGADARRLIRVLEWIRRSHSAGLLPIGHRAGP